MKSRQLMLGALLIGGMIVAPIQASAYAFYWGRIAVQTSTENSCMTIAYGVASHLGLSGAKRGQLAITGSRYGADATITCFSGSPKAMAVIMVVSNSDAAARKLYGELIVAIPQGRMLDY